MKWYNTRLDKLPADKQEVLISDNGEHYIAIYDANRKHFRVEEERELIFKTDRKKLYWTRYTKPALE
jgi:hypothetical protein